MALHDHLVGQGLGHVASLSKLYHVCWVNFFFELSVAELSDSLVFRLLYLWVRVGHVEFGANRGFQSTGASVRFGD